MKITPSKVIVDESLWPRAQYSAQYTAELAQHLRAGAVFQAIVVESGTHRLVDGRYRLEAHKIVFGDELISAVAVQYGSDAELFKDAVRRNVANSRRLMNVDYSQIIIRADDLGIERDEIASILTLKKARVNELGTRRAVTMEGDTVPLRSGLVHLSGTVLTDRQASVNRSVFGQAQLYARRLADLLEAKALDLTDRDLCTDLERLLRALLGEFG